MCFFEARELSTIDFYEPFLEKVFIFLCVVNFELLRFYMLCGTEFYLDYFLFVNYSYNL